MAAGAAAVAATGPDERIIAGWIAISALLAVVGIINALPLIGSVSAARLSGLYGVDWSDPTTILLLRHRAVLFGIIGGLILYAAFKPALQPPAMLAAAISMGSFLLFAALDRPAGAGLAGIIVSDIIGLAALGLAALLRAAQ